MHIPDINLFVIHTNQHKASLERHFLKDHLPFFASEHLPSRQFEESNTQHQDKVLRYILLFLCKSVFFHHLSVFFLLLFQYDCLEDTQLHLVILLLDLLLLWCTLCESFSSSQLLYFPATPVHPLPPFHLSFHSAVLFSMCESHLHIYPNQQIWNNAFQETQAHYFHRQIPDSKPFRPYFLKCLFPTDRVFLQKTHIPTDCIPSHNLSFSSFPYQQGQIAQQSSLRP